jgi:hypothetical protein
VHHKGTQVAIIGFDLDHCRALQSKRAAHATTMIMLQSIQ